jgi:hypothetical protein
MQDGIRVLTETDLNALTTTKQTQYGAIGCTEDGRRFRYVSFGGTAAVAAGQLVTAPVITNTTSGYQGLTITATSVAAGGQVTGNLALGSTQLVLTNGATAITQDQFAEGFLDVLVGALGITASATYRIKGNTAAAASTGYVTVFLAEPLRNTTALVPGTDICNLQVSPYSSVIISSTAALPVGVTIMPVPNTSTVTNYGWVQVGGECSVVNDAGAIITVGGGFGQSVSVSGAVRASTASTVPLCGIVRVAAPVSAVSPAWLTLT